MQNKVTFGVNHGGLRNLAMMAIFALFAGTQTAQSTELRIMTPQAQRCDANCQQRAQSCYRHAKTDSARESCEGDGTRCRRAC